MAGRGEMIRRILEASSKSETSGSDGRGSDGRGSEGRSSESAIRATGLSGTGTTARGTSSSPNTTGRARLLANLKERPVLSDQGIHSPSDGGETSQGSMKEHEVTPVKKLFYTFFHDKFLHIRTYVCRYVHEDVEICLQLSHKND